ncbi:hypothetical protein [Roseivivax sediminis]|uniref:Uncharacterized protein n=1 Tax=Roseivivax sediminis TaxID=936889 RepID=A0A1I1Y8S8_9RHOB|nr:hypothetical protein [Roseivivax sediminis]SFE14270.1 hypothetical protein SAMN04515678_106276 [Roseivivax sediminis]
MSHGADRPNGTGNPSPAERPLHAALRLLSLVAGSALVAVALALWAAAAAPAQLPAMPAFKLGLSVFLGLPGLSLLAASTPRRSTVFNAQQGL